MDKRIIIVIICFLSISLGFFILKKWNSTEVLTPIYAVSVEKITAGDSVVFSDLTPGAQRWTWDFGDREYGDKQKMAHTYLNPGTYTVKLTVSSGSASGRDSSKLITVVAAAPKVQEPVVVDAPEVIVPQEETKPTPAPAPKPKKAKHHGGDDDMELPTIMGASEVKK